MGANTKADEWQAATARHEFSRLIDAAASGRPQTVRRRDGSEVVVVSKAYFDRTRPTLKSVLLQGMEPHEGDASFDEAMLEARQVIGRVFMPRLDMIESLTGDRAGHGPPARPAPDED